jgi:preprotein translocase subunit SecY
MSAFIDKANLIFSDRGLRKRIFFVLFALFVFRVGAHIPIPAVDPAQLANLFAGGVGDLLGLLNIFSGGGLSNLSIFMLGVGPYITASIIMQLGTMMIPSLKALLHEEGEIGRKKFNQYSRLLTVPLAFLQGFSLLALLGSQGMFPVALTPQETILNVIIIVAGSLLLMWIGELISEYGIGNGVSVIIFAGIIAQLPTSIGQLAVNFTQADIPLYLLFLAVGLLVLAGVVAVTEAERPVPVTYAKQVRGGRLAGGSSTYLPLRINQAGVMPIIFALSLLLFPQIVGNFLAGSSVAFLATIGGYLVSFSTKIYLYGPFYFILVFLFTYFYTAITFDPEAVATNLQRGGAFIPGVRPGEPTARYLSNIVGRITMVGAVFLGFVAVLPFVMQAITGNAGLAIGGTSLLIVVSVVIDLIKKVNAQVSMREY